MRTTFKLRDTQRLRKTYPAIRRKPIYRYISDKPASMEVGIVNFVNADTATYTFKNDYSLISSGNPPVISLTVETTGEDLIQAFISNQTALEPKTGDTFTISTSAPFTGKVHVTILEIGA